jgi:IgA Peptidase M64
MSTADGRVLGTTKLVDNGPPELRWNLVLMGDGYQASQLPIFRSDADAFVAKLRSTEPFGGLMRGINVFRVDVQSTDGGARDPVACGGTGAAPRTFFDASFCNQNIQRLLTVNVNTALSTASAQVPQVRMTMVIVNSLVYGGSGGSIAVFSRDPQAPEIAVHEMGHTAFGFADEYESFGGCNSGEIGHERYTGREPIEPNVTADISRLKWGNLTAASTMVPTTATPNCAVCDPRVVSPVPAGTIGAFEGARYFHCGAYRPEFDCRMRVLGKPFCGVCQDVIRRHLAPFMPAEV